MATILTKKSDTASAVPLAADLTNAAGGAELAVNATDKRLFSKTSGGTVVELGTNPSSLSVVGNATVGGTLGVTGATTLAGVSATTLSASSTVTLSGGTANGVAYLNGSKVVTSGSALTFDGTTFKVQNNNTVSPVFQIQSYASVGTAIANITYDQGTDIYKLSNPSTYSGSGIDFGTGASSTTRYHIDTSGVHVWTVASEGMRLTSTGLGIGTSSPAYSLHVRKAADGVILLDSSTAGYGTFFAQSGLAEVYLGTSNNYSLGLYTNAVKRATLDTSGNLGLGVTPSAWASFYKGFDLSTYSAVYGASTNNAGLINNGYFNGTNWIYKNTAAASNYYQSGGAHAWFNAPSGTAGNAITFTQAMTLDSSGNLLVGTTSTSGYSGLIMGSGKIVVAPGVYSSTTGASANVYVAADGSLNRSTSSLKYKQNVNDAVHGLSDLLQLRAVTYESKNQNEQGIVYGGLIAEEVHAAGLNEFVQYAEDGTPDALAYGNMVSLCIKAIQEQQAIIESLKARLDAANL